MRDYKMQLEIAERQRDEALIMLVDLYRTAHRDGWMPGESTDEVCDRAHSFLCNHNLDPYTNGGPANAKKVRAKLSTVGAYHNA